MRANSPSEPHTVARVCVYTRAVLPRSYARAFVRSFEREEGPRWTGRANQVLLPLGSGPSLSTMLPLRDPTRAPLPLFSRARAPQPAARFFFFLPSLARIALFFSLSLSLSRSRLFILSLFHSASRSLSIPRVRVCYIEVYMPRSFSESRGRTQKSCVCVYNERVYIGFTPVFPRRARLYLAAKGPDDEVRVHPLSNSNFAPLVYPDFYFRFYIFRVFRSGVCFLYSFPYSRACLFFGVL